MVTCACLRVRGYLYVVRYTWLRVFGCCAGKREEASVFMVAEPEHSVHGSVCKIVTQG